MSSTSVTRLVLVAISVAFVGCTTSTPEPPLVLNRVGPGPQLLRTSPPNGYLLVSPPRLPRTTLDDPDMSTRANYKILSSDGALYRSIRTWVSDHSPEPPPIPLPAGLYTVEASAKGYGRVLVPVLIETNRMTTVHLSGQFDHGAVDLASSDYVTLPGGPVVGRRATGSDRW